jgi:amphi-Trp domain-containing protein
MGKDKKSLSVDFVGNVQEIAQKLEEFVKAFVSGTVCINSSGEELVLKPQNTIHLELEAATREGKEKVSFKMKWHKHIEMDNETASSFTVSDTPTAIEPEETALEMAEELVETLAEEPAKEADQVPEAEVEEPKGKKDRKKGCQD